MDGRFILETERLRLREVTLADLDFIAAMVADPEVMRFWPRPCTRAEAQKGVLKQLAGYRRYGHGYWLTLDRQSSQPIGQVGLLMSVVEGAEQPALGYMLHRPFWGRGYATEAAAGVLKWAFEQYGYERVICLIRPENVASLRVAIRLGLRPEKHVVFKGFNHLVFAARQEAGEGRQTTGGKRRS
jgi:ribosomal-protein-alanine N-acetyltransferase